MEVFFQLLDSDYIKPNSSPIIRVFGKTDSGKTVCIFFENFYPYFYALPKKNSKEEVINFLKDQFKNTVINIEETEKFLPFGFQRKKIPLLKIFLNDPSKTPLVRDALLEKNFIENVFEADILFKYRFMADQNLGGMRWYKVNGELVDTSTTKTDFCIKASTIEEVEDRTTNLKFLCIDIESFPKEGGIPDWKKDAIEMISLKFNPKFEGRESLVLVSFPLKKNYKNVLSFQNEKEMLKEFLRIIDSFDPDVITGYNINNFDFPYILQRLTLNKLSKAMGRCSSKQATCRKIGTKYRNSITGRVIADVFELVKFFIEKETQMSISFSKMTRLKRYGLDDVAREYLGEGKTLDRKEVLKYWNGKEGDIEKIIDYTKQDAKLTLRLLLEKNLLDKYYELAKVSGLLLQDVLDGGEAARVENLLLREFNKHDFALPNKPSDEEVLRRKNEREIKGLKGALVLEPKTGLHVNPTIYLDFKSMYPSIFIYYNICPTTLLRESLDVEKIKTPFGVYFISKKIREGIIPKIVSQLIRERDIVRKLLKISTDENEKKTLDAKQEALKRVANAFYGYTGYMRARLYSIDIANAITSCGRFLIQKTKEIIENDKFKVIYGDTDSLFIGTNAKNFDEAFELGKKLEEKVNEEIGKIVTTKIENVFKSLLILTKKRYTGLAIERVNGESEEKIVMKGIETVRRDWCNLASKTLYKVLEILLKEQNPKKVFDFVKDVIKKIEKNEIPLEDLVITKSISKPISTYKGVQPHVELVKKMKKRALAEAPVVGERVGFVIVQGPQLISERAEDPEFVKTHNLKIDSRYYIESQILPPLERVFDVIGIKKSELLGIGKQTLLADIINKEVKIRKILSGFDGMVCNKCLKTYRRIPLLGKCLKCGGELLFYSGTETSRYFTYEPS